MGIVENSTVRFGFRFCFYGSVLSRFPKRFINDISWIRTTQWNAWLNLPELESSGNFLYTSSLATFSTLRRLLSIVKVGRVPDLRDGCLIVALGRHCEASEEVGADSFITPPGTLCMHRKPNRVEGGPVFEWLTTMLRPVSHINRSPVPILNNRKIVRTSLGATDMNDLEIYLTRVV